jgi:hypothetical protein
MTRLYRLAGYKPLFLVTWRIIYHSLSTTLGCSCTQLLSITDILTIGPRVTLLKPASLTESVPLVSDGTDNASILKKLNLAFSISRRSE